MIFAAQMLQFETIETTNVADIKTKTVLYSLKTII